MRTFFVVGMLNEENADLRGQMADGQSQARRAKLAAGKGHVMLHDMRA